jgi:hypothetical protein
MKKGKIILSAAAFVVTAASVLAFKVHSKFHNQGVIYGTKGSGVCTLSTCLTVPGTGVASGRCHTINNSSPIALGTNGSGSYWKATNPSQNHRCTHPTIRWTRVF